ncbi:hypothetical protein CR513_40986, partial [Mucuna pruriens]
MTNRKEMCGIRHHSRETLHEYWERFNKLCVMCPHHQISEQLLIQYFYEGLTMMDRSMIDVVSGGVLMDKTSVVARHLISNMASNTQQFGIKGASQPRIVNEIGAIDNLRLENQLTKLTSLPESMAYVLSWSTPLICAPTLKETKSDHPESVGAIGGYQYRKQSYQSRPFDNQQFEKQPFQSGLSQGPYAAQQFGLAPNALQGPIGYRKSTPQYQAPPSQ